MSFDLQCAGCGLVGQGVLKTPTQAPLCGNCFEARYPQATGIIESQSTVSLVEAVPGANPLGRWHLAPCAAATSERCSTSSRSPSTGSSKAS